VREKSRLEGTERGRDREKDFVSVKFSSEEELGDAVWRG
jgi:hypothetical protein